MASIFLYNTIDTDSNFPELRKIGVRCNNNFPIYS